MLTFPAIDPIIIPLGPLAISWYSLSYVVGILLGWLYINYLINHNYTELKKEQIADFVNWLIIAIIIGGRLVYVLFYHPAKYLAAPLDIFKTYEGGMSFHGGLLGVAIAARIFTKKYKISYFTLIDMIAAAAPIAILLGRLANFINAELYGRKTDVAWSFVFPGSDGQPRHPSQLYEAALEGFVLFFILYIMISKYRACAQKGLISGLFLIFYAIFRLIIEIFREPDLQLGLYFNLFTQGQLLCLPMLIVGIILIKYPSR